MSLLMRYRSLDNDTFTGKVVAALRNEFGGHAVEKNKNVDFYYVVDESPDLSSKFSIMSIPTLVNPKTKRKRSERSVGFIPEETVKEFALS
jgi:hypothetical protein